MEKFDFNKAFNGGVVCTENGMDVTIDDILFRNNQILATVHHSKDWKETVTYNRDGSPCIGERAGGNYSGYNLMMKNATREGWVNIYKGDYVYGPIFNTRDDAVRNIGENRVCLDTIKVTYKV